MPGVVAGTLLTFIPAAGDYVNAELLGGPNNTMIGNVIQWRFLIPDYPTTSALSFMLRAAILIIVVVYIRKAGTDEVV
jgi:spermidine/putrescine transport system permease protein